jgi:hypothetical protein
MSVENQPVVTCNHHVLSGGDRCRRRFGGDRVESPRQLRSRANLAGWTKTLTPWMTEIDLCPDHEPRPDGGAEDDPADAATLPGPAR